MWSQRGYGEERVPLKRLRSSRKRYACVSETRFGNEDLELCDPIGASDRSGMITLMLRT